MNHDYRLDALSSFVEFEMQGCDRKPDNEGEQIMRPDSLPHPKTCGCPDCLAYYQKYYEMYIDENYIDITGNKECQACAGMHEPHTTCHPKPDEDRSTPMEIDRFLIWGEPELDTNGNRQFTVATSANPEARMLVSLPARVELADYLYHWTTLR